MQLNWDLRDSDQVKSELTTGKLMPFGDGFIAKFARLLELDVVFRQISKISRRFCGHCLWA